VRALAYGLEFWKFKRRLNVIKRFFGFFSFWAKSGVITQLEVIIVTIPLAAHLFLTSFPFLLGLLHSTATNNQRETS